MRQSTLLMALATSLGDGQAMMASLRSLIADSKGTWQHKLTRLAYLLNDGSSLSEACSAVKGIVPERTQIAIRVAEPAGALKQVLADEAYALMQVGRSDVGQPRIAKVVFGLLILLCVTQWMLSFVMIFIVPKFRDIFEGFGVELPAATQLLIRLSNWCLHFWPILVFPFITLVVYTIVFAIYGNWKYLTVGRRLLTPRWPRYWTPELLRSLAVTIAAQRPIPEAIHAFLSEMSPGKAAWNLSAVRSSAESGSDFWQALKQYGFLKRSEVAVLRSAQAAGNPDWAMVQLAEQIEYKRQRWRSAMATILQPLAMLTVGIGIAFVIVSLYLPLFALMRSLGGVRI